MKNPLILQILKEGRNHHLQLENRGDTDLENVEVLLIELRNHNELPMIQFRFTILPLLSAQSTGTVEHQVYVEKDGRWSAAQENDWYNNEMLACLTEKLSRGASYEVNVSWFENGKPNHQILQAGAGSGLKAHEN